MGISLKDFCCTIKALKARIASIEAVAIPPAQTAGDGLSLIVNEFSVDGSVARKTLTLSQFAATTSAQLASLLSDETGTGPAVFATNPFLVNPKVYAFYDANNLVWLSTGTVASPVNSVRIDSSATGVGPAIYPVGADTNVDLNLTGKGTGVVKAATAAPATNTTQIATTAYVVTALSSYLTTATASATYAPIASPTFTGIPSAPTATTGVNTTQLATTAFVNASITVGGFATTSGTLAQFAATTSLQLKNLISDETGSGALVFATNPALVTPDLGTPSAGIAINMTVEGTNRIGFRNIPSNPQAAAYTTVLDDSGRSIDHLAADANIRTYTIAGAVAYPVGSCISFSNMTSQVITIAITTDVMYLAGAGTTGSRILAQFGVATARKQASGVWIISGINLT